MQTILKKSSSPTNFMQFILYTFIVALFNLFVLQDPSIPKSKFLIKEMYVFCPYTNLS